MNFKIDKTIEILERTPDILIVMLQGISPEWTTNNEGGETWSVYDIIGHLIHGEKTDWMPRIEIIISDKPEKTFEIFDRFAQFKESKEKSLIQLLDEFKSLRRINLDKLFAMELADKQMEEKGIHPSFGEVRLSQLLAAWVVHDLNHISQISRVIAKQYTEEVGPWIEYLRILKQ